MTLLFALPLIMILVGVLRILVLMRQRGGLRRF